MSMAPGWPLMAVILARITVAAPVISSTVSPRTLSAMRKPPICAGVALPDIMMSKACSASARDRVAPPATLPIRPFRSGMSPLIAASPSSGRRSGVGELQEVQQQRMARLGGDALRMELHAVDRQGLVLQTHDDAVLGSRGHLQRLVREARRIE